MSIYAGVILTTDKSRAQRVLDEIFGESRVKFVIEEFLVEPEDEDDSDLKPITIYAVHYESAMLSVYNDSKDKLLAILDGASWHWEWTDLAENPSQDNTQWSMSEDWYDLIKAYGTELPGLVVEVEVTTNVALKEW